MLIIWNNNINYYNNILFILQKDSINLILIKNDDNISFYLDKIFFNILNDNLN